MACIARFEMPRNMAKEAIFFIASTPLAVREALHTIMADPAMANMSDDNRGSTEVVFAEVLNNIVEHASDCENSKIEIRLRRTLGMLCCDIFDVGAPMPQNELPAGLAQTIGPDHTLPEGGFGWFLIRTLTTHLNYERIDARNHLSFQLNIEQ